jgi:hypothetical protein
VRLLKGFGRFWYELVIGDDWKIAVVVVGALGLTLLGLATDIISAGAAPVIGAALVAVGFTTTMVIDVRRRP